MISNADKLRQIIKDHNFTRPEIADICGVSRWLVNAWLADSNWNMFRNMNDDHLEKLEDHIATIA